MPAVDAGVVFLPRFTTLVGQGEFATAPLDVSREGGVQFQLWRGPVRVSSGNGTFSLYIEESLDAATWSLGPATPQAVTIEENVSRFFSISFRLRWFRLRVYLAGTSPMVSCWAEGILRGGDGGAWGLPGSGNRGGVGAGMPVFAPAGMSGGREQPGRGDAGAYMIAQNKYALAMEAWKRKYRGPIYGTSYTPPAPPTPPSMPFWWGGILASGSQTPTINVKQ